VQLVATVTRLRIGLPRTLVQFHASGSDFKCVRKITKRDYWLRYACLSVCRLSVRLEQLGCHWTDFREIWYLIIFWKSVQKC